MRIVTTRTGKIILLGGVLALIAVAGQAFAQTTQADAKAKDASAEQAAAKAKAEQDKKAEEAKAKAAQAKAKQASKTGDEIEEEEEDL